MNKNNSSFLLKIKQIEFQLLMLISNRFFSKELIHCLRLPKWFNQLWLDIEEVLSPTRRRQARFERENPDTPRLVPAAIAFSEQKLRPEFVGFELGRGRSKISFAWVVPLC